MSFFAGSCAVDQDIDHTDDRPRDGKAHRDDGFFLAVSARYDRQIEDRNDHDQIGDEAQDRDQHVQEVVCAPCGPKTR